MYRLVVLLHNKMEFYFVLYFSNSLFLHRTSSWFYNFFEGFLFGAAFFGGLLIVQLTVVYTSPFHCFRVYFVLCDLPNNAKNRPIFFLEPGTAPRKVQVRPLSSSTMVIQWDEPETPNGQVTVGVFVLKIIFLPNRNKFANEHTVRIFIGIQSVLHNGFESTDGVVAIPNGG